MSDVLEMYKQAFGEEALNSLVKEARDEIRQDSIEFYKQAFGQEALNDLINESAAELRKEIGL